MKTNTVFDLTHIDTHGLCVTPYSNTGIPMWAVFTGIPLMESEHIHMLSLYLGHIATLVYSKLIINQDGLWTLLIYLQSCWLLQYIYAIIFPYMSMTFPWNQITFCGTISQNFCQLSFSWGFKSINLTIRVIFMGIRTKRHPIFWDPNGSPNRSLAGDDFSVSPTIPSC